MSKVKTTNVVLDGSHHPCGCGVPNRCFMRFVVEVQRGSERSRVHIYTCKDHTPHAWDHNAIRSLFGFDHPEEWTIRSVVETPVNDINKAVASIRVVDEKFDWTAGAPGSVEEDVARDDAERALLTHYRSGLHDGRACPWCRDVAFFAAKITAATQRGDDCDEIGDGPVIA